MEMIDGSNKPARRLDADLLSLRALAAVADAGGFSAAGARIGRSQSAVSLQVAKLEERVGARLFDRTTRSVRLTPQGETLLSYARRILALADEAMTALDAPPTKDPLRVGAASHLSPLRLPATLARFRRAHPGAAITLRYACGHDLITALRDGALDVVVCGPEAEGGRRLLAEPLVWAGPADIALDPLGSDDPVPLVLMAPPCTYRRAAFDALTAAERRYREVMTGGSLQEVQDAVAAGFGVSAIARSALTASLRPMVDGWPALPDTAVDVFLSDGDAHPLAERFVATISADAAALQAI